MAGEKAHLIDFGDGGQGHYAHFTLWYDGQTEAQITIRVKGPAPPQENPIAVYRPLLHRLGVAAQIAAGSPQALSWPKIRMHRDGGRNRCPPPRDSRFGSPLKLSRVHWVKPELVVEVTYLTWTEDNLLRQVSYQGSGKTSLQSRSSGRCRIRKGRAKCWRTYAKRCAQREEEGR
jgi:hypothetical protein